jgi:hypothetical protein
MNWNYGENIYITHEDVLDSAYGATNAIYLNGVVDENAKLEIEAVWLSDNYEEYEKIVSDDVRVIISGAYGSNILEFRLYNYNYNIADYDSIVIEGPSKKFSLSECYDIKSYDSYITAKYDFTSIGSGWSDNEYYKVKEFIEDTTPYNMGTIPTDIEISISARASEGLVNEYVNSDYNLKSTLTISNDEINADNITVVAK